MTSFDDLFNTGKAEDQQKFNDGAEQIIYVPLTELHSFQNHPFRVIDDEKMAETVESIREHGVLVPAIARHRQAGGYEIISGHRRRRASELAGKTDMPVIVRDYSDDEATIIMVDSNIQRENLLPSEKSKAYAMKYDAIKHQGKRGNKPTLELIGETAGDNAKKVQRYIWLSRLNDDLLNMVDQKQIGITQGVNISFLSPVDQDIVLRCILNNKHLSISVAQSEQLKEYGQQGKITEDVVELILTDRPRKRQVVLSSSQLMKYFSEDYTAEGIENVIVTLLEEWAARQN